MIPVFLLSTCADRMSDLCSGSGCAEAVKQNPETGRWFITMGHPGFNCRINNGAGFLTRSAALRSLRHFAGLAETIVR